MAPHERRPAGHRLESDPQEVARDARDGESREGEVRVQGRCDIRSSAADEQAREGFVLEFEKIFVFSLLRFIKAP